MAIANFPHGQDDKNTYYLGSRGRIVAKQSRLLVSDENITELNHRIDDATFWIDIFTKHKSEDADTTTVKNRVIVLIGLVEEQFKLIFADIPASVLDTDDYTVFHFNPGDAGHAKIIAQATAGTLSFESAHHLGQKIRLKNPLTPEKDAMPHGNHARIWVGVMPKKVDNSLIVWGNNPSAMTSRFHEESFTEEQVGQFAVYKTCYENAKGEQGDASEPFWLVIS
jgi:hypothetical protein